MYIHFLNPHEFILEQTYEDEYGWSLQPYDNAFYYIKKLWPFIDNKTKYIHWYVKNCLWATQTNDEKFQNFIYKWVVKNNNKHIIKHNETVSILNDISLQYPPQASFIDDSKLDPLVNNFIDSLKDYITNNDFELIPPHYKYKYDLSIQNLKKAFGDDNFIYEIYHLSLLARFYSFVFNRPDSNVITKDDLRVEEDEKIQQITPEESLEKFPARSYKSSRDARRYKLASILLDKTIDQVKQLEIDVNKWLDKKYISVFGKPWTHDSKYLKIFDENFTDFNDIIHSIIAGKVLDNNGFRQQLIQKFNDVASIVDFNQTNIYPLNTFNISSSELNIIKKLLKRKKCNILIYGAPGIGKTELTKSLIKTLFGEYINFNSCITPNISSPFQVLQDISFYASKIKIPVLIDECDNLLNCVSVRSTKQGLTKSVVNGYLENMISNNIWICNYIDFIDLSTMRRFDYVLYLKPPEQKQYENLWRNMLKLHDVKYRISKKELSDITKFNKLSVANITNIIKNTLLVSQENNKKNFLYCLKQNCKLFYSSVYNEQEPNIKKDDIFTPVKQYDLSSLNVNYNPNKIISSIKRFIDIKNKEAPMSLLFSGLPGTGKTEFAKEIARQVNKKLLVKRYSDLSNCFVGETEKNIANVFKQATEKDAILLIDECDSFLSERKNSQRSWEVTQVNEMLTQLEAYRGIVIMSTNFIDNLDSAAMRRFCWKIKFDTLKYNAKETMIKKYFNKKTLSDDNKRKLEKMDLTFGDFKAVSARMKMVSTSQKEDDIIKELEEESSYRHTGNKIGF